MSKKTFRILTSGICSFVLSINFAQAQSHSGTNSTATKVDGEYHPPAAVSGRPCDSEKDCAELVKLENGTVVGAVVKRTVNDKGFVEKFVKDKDSGLVWSPQIKTGGKNNDGQMTQKEASHYCEALNKNNPIPGLKWGLPSKEEFRVAFDSKNPDKDDLIPTNPNFKQVLSFRDTPFTEEQQKKDALFQFSGYRFLWSSQSLENRGENDMAWGYAYAGGLDGHSVSESNFARCLGRTK
jgi:hypothetical protein